MKLWIKLTNGPSSIAADADWIRTAASVLSDVSVFRVGLPRSNVWVASCGPLAKRSKVDGERNPRPTLSTSATGSDTWYSMPKLPVTELQWRLAAGGPPAPIASAAGGRGVEGTRAPATPPPPP